MAAPPFPIYAELLSNHSDASSADRIFAAVGPRPLDFGGRQLDESSRTVAPAWRERPSVE
jgi:hypothetical protein